MLNIRKGLMAYINLFVSSVIPFFVVNSIIVIIQILCNKLLKTAYIIDYNQLRVVYIIPVALLLSLFSLSSYLYTTKAIRIEDKKIDEARIKHTMENMKWKIKEEQENLIIFISPLSVGLFKEKMTINFTEYEIYITGPRRFLETMISGAKFPYGAFEISNPKQVNKIEENKL